jgi:hypothetical protein
MLPNILSYNKFTSSRAATFNSTTNNDIGGFNLASGTNTFKINDRTFNLFSNRLYTVSSHIPNKEIIPGNTCDENILSSYLNDVTIKKVNSFYGTRYKEIDRDDLGKNYYWGDWNNPKFINESCVFIGEVTQDNRIIETQTIIDKITTVNVKLDDIRLLYLKSIKISENMNDNYHLYLIIPRTLIDSNYYLVIIKYDSEKNKFINKNYNIPTGVTNRNIGAIGLSTGSINTPSYKFEIINKDDITDELSLYYFNWYENSCVTQFINSVRIPNDNKIISTFNGLSHFGNYFNGGSSNLKIECMMPIKNIFLEGNMKLLPEGIMNIEMSFGSPFVNCSNNKLLGVGHSKLLSNRSIYGYNSHKLNKIQELVPKTLRKLFGNNYKQHHSAFQLKCTTGYNYLSYFIKYDDNAKTFNISDFFIPIDLSDKYHFSLIFTTGIFNIGDNTFITSGEGDYYSSIIKYNTNKLLDSCRHNVLSESFNLNDINYYFQLKYLDGKVENILIDETLNIHQLYNKCFYLSASTYLENTSSRRNQYYRKKYLKYKNKYIKLKNELN